MRVGRLGLAIVGLAVAAVTAVSASGSHRAASPSSAAVAQVPSDWGRFRDSFIEGWFRLVPSDAVYQGRHDFDGQLPDWSPAGLKAQGDFLRAAIARAGRFDARRMTKEDAFERDYLVKVAEGKLFWLEDADQPHRNPAYYVGAGLDPNVYLARPYASPLVRMRALTRFFRAVPAAAANIRTNLRTPLPASFVDYGVASFGGFADFYAKDALQAFAGVRDREAHRDLEAAAKQASHAMAGLTAWLKAQAPHATQDFALGPDRFTRMLRTTEAVDAPLATIEAAGRADLARNRAAMEAACKAYAPGRSVPDCVAKMNADKPAGGPVAEARRQIPMLRAFVLSHHLVTIPGTEHALVNEAPPYNRQNFAYIDPPGPYDKGIPSVYYIAPPDPAWTKAVRDAFVPGRADLLFTSVHEVMPGHFVQFLHANRSPSIFGRLFVGYAFAEGWAHYTEQMMWDAGLGAGDAKVHIGQLSNALLRDCRFLSAIGMHAHGMTQAQSRAMFVSQCYQDEGSARQQAARGTYDPAYLNYTLGKLMIGRLRADWTQSRGGRRAWRAFHDRFLSYGGPPIPLVRAAMMGGPARAVF